MIGVGLAAKIGLKLLGVGKALKKFFIANWKIIVPIMAAIALYFFVVDKIDDARVEGYNSGIAFQKAEHKKAIDEENEFNRKFEQKMGETLATFVENITREAQVRVVKENTLERRVETIVRDNPVYTQCVVDQEVIDARNEIRKLGPQEKSE